MVIGGRVWIEQVAGLWRGRRWVFDEHDVLLVGHAPDCRVRLSPADPDVARHHLLLEVNPPRVRVRDLRGGTDVAARAVPPLLGPGRAASPGATAISTPISSAATARPAAVSTVEPVAVELRHGDELRVGAAVLRLTLESSGPASAVDHRTDSGNGIGPRIGTGTGTGHRPDQNAEHHPDHTTRAASSDPQALVARILAEAAATDRVTPVIPDYELRSMLGAGGYGAVHLARHRASGRLVALKVLLPRGAVEPGTRGRFRKETDVQARIAHPNVVGLHESGETAGVLWFTMEYCEGGSLATHVQRNGGRLALADAAPLMLGALAGLAAAHEHGFVHRDVKPHNILLARPSAAHTTGSSTAAIASDTHTDTHTDTVHGGEWVAKISDFGLARSFVETGLFGMTTTEGQAGSWPYLPREQLLDFRDVRPTTDVWSVAATFYEVLTGVPPRDVHPGQDPVVAVLEARPVPIRERDPDLSRSVAEVIDRALDVEVDRRHRDAHELRAALSVALTRQGD